MDGDRAHQIQRRHFLAALGAAASSGAARAVGATLAGAAATAATEDALAAGASSFDSRGDGAPSNDARHATVRHERHRAVVIGSGLGGAVAALRLGQAGVQTLVLERGRAWPLTPSFDTFPSFWKPDQRTAWFRRTPAIPGSPLRIFKPYPGLFEKIKGCGTDVIVGAGVGGSTLVYGGIMIQPTRELFERMFPEGVDYDELDRHYYPRARAEIGFDTIPDDILTSDSYLAARVFERQVGRADMRSSRILSTTHWNVVRDELEGRVPACYTRGEYFYGASNGAKRSVDRNYLPRAEATGFVEVRALHLVREIGECESGQGYRVLADRIDEAGAIVERLHIRCDRLFLGAGSMGTSRLLVNARETGTLRRLNDHVGRHWGNNGERVFMRLGVGEKTGAPQGGPPPVGVLFERTSHGPVSLECAVAPLPFELNAIMIAGIGIPEAAGQFVYEPKRGDARLRWPKTAARSARKASLEAIRRIDRANSGGLLIDFDSLMGTTCYHPLGGAVLGRACDWYGRVRGQPGLYVTDSAMIPGAVGCANPAWTIAALAERCLDRVLDEDFSAPG